MRDSDRENDRRDRDRDGGRCESINRTQREREIERGNDVYCNSARETEKDTLRERKSVYVKTRE